MSTSPPWPDPTVDEKMLTSPTVPEVLVVIFEDTSTAPVAATPLPALDEVTVTAPAVPAAPLAVDSRTTGPAVPVDARDAIVTAPAVPPVV